MRGLQAAGARRCSQRRDPRSAPCQIGTAGRQLETGLQCHWELGIEGRNIMQRTMLFAAGQAGPDGALVQMR